MFKSKVLSYCIGNMHLSGNPVNEVGFAITYTIKTISVEGFEYESTNKKHSL